MITKKDFLKITKNNYKIWKTWSKYKQSIVVSAVNAQTGNFINEKTN